MSARTVAELMRVRRVADNYRAMSIEIEDVAAEQKLRGMPLTVRALRKYASIARKAARAEELDPEPVEA